MRITQVLSPLLFAGLSLAAPPSKRSTTSCDQWGTVVTGAYTVYQDLWGEATATSGSQCMTVNDAVDNVISWTADWSWAGESYDVHSYANVQSSATVQKLISSISTIPSSWAWTYSGTDIIADVSYDIFTDVSASGVGQYEIMIWLAALGGAGPLSTSGSPIASDITIDGYTFNLYLGSNGVQATYSFVATSDIASFSGDILSFFTYLIDDQSFPTDQYLLEVSSGTEAFTGTDAVFTTSSYSISLS